MTPRLQVNDTQGKRVVPLDKPLFRIGRRTESDLRVSGVDVSREYAEVEQGGNGGWLLRDRGSCGGTFVNNEPVTERILRHGDQIRLGLKSGAELVFLLDDSVPAPSASTTAVAEFRQVASLYGALAEDGRLTYCNAGHNPPILIGRNGMKLLETGGLILGMFPQAVYDQETLVLDPGDVLVMYTDGVTEALNPAGEEFGEGRLRACLDANRHSLPAELLDSLLSAVRSFVAGAAQHDDVTALVMRYVTK